jgi:lysozyme
MKTSAQGRKLIEDAEDCKLQAYLCPAGVPTIGIGHTKGVRLGMSCTREQADQWLAEDLQSAESDIARLVKVPLTQGQFDALASFIFNMGGDKFAHSTLLKMLNDGRVFAAASQFKLWTHSNGVELPGLVKRRNAESELFLKDAKEPA